MRMPKYLSPSSLSKFENNMEEAYLKYLCETRPPRGGQFDFMGVGSGLDAFTKHEIHRNVFGLAATQGGKYDRDGLFEEQVEEPIRDIVRPRAEDLWRQYKESGAFPALMADIALSPFAPEMEFTVEGRISGVPLLGKPDLRYITKEGVHVIADWKVNGSTSKTGASPIPGYSIARDAYNSTTHNKPYRARRPKGVVQEVMEKDFRPIKFKDVVCDTAYLNDRCDYWADQLAIYSWLLGEPVGSEEYVVRMEQIACRPVKHLDLPRAKFATHMNRISTAYQERLVTRLTTVWAILESGHIFTDRSREKSDKHCELLDAQAKTPLGLFPGLDECVAPKARF
jgi:hypothetical protein